MACSSQMLPRISLGGTVAVEHINQSLQGMEGVGRVSIARDSESRDLLRKAHLKQTCSSRGPRTASCAAGVVEAAPAQEEVPAGGMDSTLAAKPKWGGGGGGRQRVKSRPNETQEGGSKLQWLKQDGVDLTSECMVSEDEMCGRASAGLVRLQRAVWRVNRAIARCTSVREALQVVEEMKAAGLNAANEGTYVALITVCRRQRQGERALVVYEAMKAAGVRPSLLTFNTLISCCQQAQRLEDAFQLKVDMEKCSVTADVVTYTSLMALLVKAGPYRGRSSPTQRLGKAMDLYREMQQREVKPDAQTFNTLMYASAQAKLPGKVLEVYGMMSAAGVVPNHFTFGILLEAVGEGGRLKQALEILNEMKAAGVAPQTSTYNSILEACSTAPQPAAVRAWALYDEMKAQPGVMPNAETMAHLLTASCKGGDHEGALRAFDLMHEKGFTSAITPSTYNKLIHSGSKCASLDAAFQMYERMKGAGYAADRVTYGTLISACKEAGDLERVVSVHKEMQEGGLKADQVVYHALMGAYGEAGRWEESVASLQEMKRNFPEEAVQLASYSIAFDACFGREGAAGAVAAACSSGGRLEITEGVKAAVKLYQEGVLSGVFKNFSDDDLTRCDMRQMTRSGVVICILAWLEHLRVHRVRTDIVVVTGSDKGRSVRGPKKGRFPKLFVSAEQTFKAIGLKAKNLETLTMQALTVENDDLQSWLESSTDSVLRPELEPQLVS